MCLKTFVHPILKYSQTVWDPHASGVALRRSSQFREEQHGTHSTDHRTSSMSAMIAELNWQTVREWNILPPEVIQLNIAESFKNAVLSM